MISTSVITVAPIAPFDNELKRKVTATTVAPYRRHNPKDCAVSAGIVWYIISKETQTTI
jgi:hypothetical protein